MNSTRTLGSPGGKSTASASRSERASRRGVFFVGCAALHLQGKGKRGESGPEFAN